MYKGLINVAKKELKKMYQEETLVDSAMYFPTPQDKVVIVTIDEDYVFGYRQYMDDEKHFFKVKTRLGVNKTTFKVEGVTYDTDEFLRVGI